MSVSIPFSYSFDDGRWINPLVNVQRDRVHIKRRVLFLSRPNQLRIKMGIVIVFLLCHFTSTYRHQRHRRYIVISFVSRQRRIGFGSDQSRRRIVHALLVFVFVLLDWALRRFSATTSRTRHHTSWE